jgi:DNA-binding MarR family transcriptional regulator
MRADSVDRHVARWRDELDYLDPVHEEVVARLMILSRHLARSRDDAHTAARLPRPSFKILLALRRLGPPYTASPSDLADHLGLSRGALSARLGPLEDGGLVTRTVDKEDRRRVHVRLTASGRRAFDRHARLEGRDEAALLGALSPSDQRRLADLLRELVLAVETAAGR